MKARALHLYNLMKKYEKGVFADPKDGEFLQTMQKNGFFRGFFFYNEMKLRFALTKRGQEYLEKLHMINDVEIRVFITDEIVVLPGGKVELIAS